ncbi:Protein of unknown function (DUF1759) [Popillia japonica]|uniref:DUF5641 domain-containing protein n=1 Tax=Popillia japonica TaxID=7064 RepID=A0AAW1I8K8_POPJA
MRHQLDFITIIAISTANTDVDKLLYLRSVLEGEAKKAIEGLEITSANCKIVIDTLRERYGKTGAIVDAHYVVLYRTRAARNCVKDCRDVLNKIERHLTVLKSLGKDVNHNHLEVRTTVNLVPQVEDTVQLKRHLDRVHWQTCRIAEVVKGSDRQIRVAKVATPSGAVVNRSIAHLYSLKISEDEEIREGENPQITQADVGDPTEQVEPRERPMCLPESTR